MHTCSKPCFCPCQSYRLNKCNSCQNRKINRCMYRNRFRGCQKSNEFVCPISGVSNLHAIEYYNGKSMINYILLIILIILIIYFVLKLF